jgi:hypothetical protein
MIPLLGGIWSSPPGHLLAGPARHVPGPGLDRPLAGGTGSHRLCGPGVAWPAARRRRRAAAAAGSSVRRCARTSPDRDDQGTCRRDDLRYRGAPTADNPSGASPREWRSRGSTPPAHIANRPWRWAPRRVVRQRRVVRFARLIHRRDRALEFRWGVGDDASAWLRRCRRAAWEAFMTRLRIAACEPGPSLPAPAESDVG